MKLAHDLKGTEDEEERDRKGGAEGSRVGPEARPGLARHCLGGPPVSMVGAARKRG